MKKSLLILTTSAFFAVAGLTSCKSSAEKVDNAKEDVIDANKALEKANEEYLADIENYRKITSDRIAANEKSIADFKLRVSEQKKDARAAYEQKIADLERKNTDNKKKLDEYKADGKDKWASFKSEFNHDMEELADAFRAMSVNNVK